MMSTTKAGGQLDTTNDTVSYAVLFFGSVIRIGEKLIAVPCKALKRDTEKKRFVLNVDKNRLKDARIR